MGQKLKINKEETGGSYIFVPNRKGIMHEPVRGKENSNNNF